MTFHSSNKMKLTIPSDMYATIMGWVYACDIEVSGMGQLKRTKDGYEVTAVHILDQTCTSVETEMSAEAMGVLEYECEDGEFKDDGDLIWWWHSHVDMPVFWSSTDMDAIEQLSPENGRIVATVFNKNREFRTAYRQGESEFSPAIFLDELETEIIPVKSAIKTVNDRVTRLQPKIPVYQQTLGSFTGLPSKSTVPNYTPMTYQQAVKACVKLGYTKSDASEIIDEFEEEMDVYPVDETELSIFIKQYYEELT